MYPSCLTLLVVIAVSVTSRAQLRVPPFDVALKAGYTFIEDNPPGGYVYKYETLFFQGELNIHVNQNIAIGYFYQRNGIVSNYHGDNDSHADRPADHLMHGVNLRLSTGRSSRWRPYINLKYILLETVVHFNGFDIAYEGSTFTGGIGVMVRLSHNLYFNVIEGEIGKLITPGEVLFKDNKILFPQLRTGITYNFSKRK